ncbi:MAG: hypothetical protein IH859_04475 [Chloroflexi bacterium]|nr:hypothetical protein [Chloroflexota bacterium]
MIEVATFYAPQPIGVAHIFKRGPYGNPVAHKQRLSGAVERGWLTKAGDGAYTPSEKGAQIYKHFAEGYKQVLAGVESLSDEILESIQSVISSVVKTASETPEVMDKPSLELSLKENLGPDASVLQKIQLLTENILSYRDDAHVASWSLHKLEGITWESFSDIWGSKISTAAELAEKRPFRGYSEDDYTASLEELAGRGWIKENKEKDGSYSITEEGRRVREKSEDITNQYYDAAWEDISASEMEKLKDLFQQLLDKHAPEKVPG